MSDYNSMVHLLFYPSHPTAATIKDLALMQCHRLAIRSPAYSRLTEMSAIT